MKSSFAFLLTCLLILPSALCDSSDPLPPNTVGSKHGNVLLSGERLSPNEFLQIDKYTLLMQENCELVLLSIDGGLVWQSGTSQHGLGCFLKMEDDGHLVLYGQDNNFVMLLAAGFSETAPFGSYAAVLQRDPKIVIYGKTNNDHGEFNFN